MSVMSFISGNKILIIAAVVVVLAFVAYKTNMHASLINAAIHSIDKRYANFEEEAKARDAARDEEIKAKEKDFTAREEVLNKQLEDLKKANEVLVSSINSKDVEIKNLEAKRNEITTKKYSTSDRNTGVKRTIDIGRNLQKGTNK